MLQLFKDSLIEPFASAHKYTKEAFKSYFNEPNFKPIFHFTFSNGIDMKHMMSFITDQVVKYPTKQTNDKGTIHVLLQLIFSRFSINNSLL